MSSHHGLRCVAELRKSLGKRTAALRRAVRPILSQEELARRVGISRSYLAKIERGEKDMPVCLAARVANQLHVPIGEYLTGLDHSEADECHSLALQICRAFQRSGVPCNVWVPAIELLAKLLIVCGGSKEGR